MVFECSSKICCVSPFQTFQKYLSDLKCRWIAALEYGFEQYGIFVYTHPWKLILYPTFICLLLTCGFFYREPELDMEVLYALPNSLSHRAKTELNKVFPIERVAYVFAVSEKNENLLTAEWLAIFDRFWQRALSLKIPKSLVEDAIIPGAKSPVQDWLLKNRPELLDIEAPDSNKATFRGPDRHHDEVTDDSEFDEALTNGTLLNSEDYIHLDDVCVKNLIRQQCQTRTPLDLYPGPAYWGRPIRTSTYPLLINFRTANGFTIDSILSGIQAKQFGPTTEVIGATGVAFRIDLDGTWDNLQYTSTWEQGLIGFVQLVKIPDIRIVVKTERSVEDVLAITGQLRGKDLLFFIVSAVLVFIYSMAMNSSTDKYRSKSISTGVGIISTILAYGGGVGVCHFFGLRHVPPSDSTPFILLAIGVDDVFVLTNAYTMTYLHTADSRRRMGMTLRDAGISISLTTITNIVAFAIGATSRYYSIVVFCIVTSTALIVGFVLVLTIFCGVLALEAAREERRYGSTILSADFERSCSELKPVVETPASNRCDVETNTTRSGPSPVSSVPSEETPKEVDGLCSTASPSDLGNSKANLETPNLDSSASIADLSSLSGDDSVINVELFSYDSTVSPLSDYNQQRGSPIRFFGVLEGSNQLVAAERIHAFRDKHLAMADEQAAYRQPWCLPPETTQKPFTRCQSRDSNPNQARVPWSPKSSARPTSVTPSGEIEILVRLSDRLIPIKEVFWNEPKGNVGRRARILFMKYYGPFITHPVIKLVVLVGFLSLFCFSAMNSRKVVPGISVRDVTPADSYLADFLNVREKYFDAYGDECVVVFPWSSHWWKPEVQSATLKLIEQLEQSKNIVRVDSGFRSLLAYIDQRRRMDMGNGIVPITNNSTDNVNGNDLTISGDNEAMEFVSLMQSWLSTSQGGVYATNFKSRETEISWKLYFWMSFVDNSAVSVGMLQEAQQYLADSADLLTGYVYTPLALMWENDPLILRITLTNMGMAVVIMGLVASLLIPDIRSGLLVLVIIFMIDVSVIGFMPLWDLRLNMLTMVNLVLSIGFAVDYTAHFTHCYNHCNGKTRNSRVIEALVLMGLPITNGAISTYFAAATLIFTDKFALMVVFRMITLVIGLAFLHGLVLVPVVLSCIGPMHPYDMDVFECKDGLISALMTIDRNTGKVLGQKYDHDQRIIRRRRSNLGLLNSSTLIF